MKIKENTELIIRHNRKGLFRAIAEKDFDTDDEWYPILTLEPVEGKANEWDIGERIPCKGKFCRLQVV